MDFLILLAGLVGLFVGGEMLVRGSVALATRLAMPPLLIGLTIVGFGTSTPELLVSVDAAWRGLPDIAIGNVVGSNIANILLIIGLAVLVWPIRVKAGTLKRNLAVMLLAAIVLVPFFMLGSLNRLAGLALLAALVGYVVWAYRAASEEKTDGRAAQARPVWQSLIFIVIGIAVLMIGARAMVDGAVAIARTFGLSEAFIGLTIVAVGTSLPELATSLIAAFRRQSEIAIGNVVGSNIFNVLGILGLTAIIAPITVADRFLTFDLPVMIGVSLLFAALLILRPVLGRMTAIPLLLGYVLYVWAAQG